MSIKALLLITAIAIFPIAASSQRAPISEIPEIVTNIPFSAQEWTETTSTRPDGTTLTRIRRVDIARNSAGSTRREARILPTASPTAQPTGSMFIEIHNVPNGQFTRLNPASTTGRVATLAKKPAKPTTLPIAIPYGAVVNGPIQDLGPRSIAGYTARGSRLNLIFPAGTKNPTQSVTQTTDTWYSSELGAVVLVQVSDSIGNSANTTLKQIVMGDPNPDLFTVPSTYTTTAIRPSASITSAQSK